MKKMKYITYLLTVALLMNFSLVHSVYGQDNKMVLVYDGQEHIYNEKPIKLIVKEQEIQGVMPPIIFQGNTLVPIREVFEAMGAVVEWKSQTKEAYIGMDDTLVILKMNNNQAWVNGEYKDLPMAPKIINNKVMIPVRFVAETIGFDVQWIGSERVVKIDLPEEEINEDEVINPVDNNDTSEDVEENTEDIEENTEDINNDTEDMNNDGEELNDSEDGLDSDSQQNDNSGDATIPYIDIDSIQGVNLNSNIPDLPTELASKPIILESQADTTEELPTSNIQSVSNPTTDIIAAKVLESSGGDEFKISASSPISSLEHMLWEGKIVVDINNATMKMAETNQSVEDNKFVQSIRSSQYSSNPKVVRVVFDLIAPSAYDIRLSSDRMSILIKIKKSIINKVELTQNQRGDILNIYGNNPPSVNVFRLTNPNRLVIDVPNSESDLTDIEKTIQGQYVKGIRTAQFDQNTYRVVLDLEGQPEYEVSSIEGNGASIQIVKPTYKNIQYINTDHPQVILKKPSGNFNARDIIQNDDYMNRVYKVTLPEDYFSIYGQGIFHIGDSKIDSIHIGKNNNNKTELSFMEKSVYAYEVYESEEYIVISIVKPSEKYNKIIVLDAGHGGSDPGASGNGLVEKDVNLDMTMRLYELLKNSPDIKVYMTRTDDSYPTLQARSKLANEVDADLFLCIHNNAFYAQHNGTEVLYFPTSNDNTSQFTGKKMAEIFQKILVQNLGTEDRGIKKRPELYVLRTTKMPAILVEIAFLTNTEDARLLKSDSFRQKTAQTLYEGVLEVFNKYITR